MFLQSECTYMYSTETLVSRRGWVGWLKLDQTFFKNKKKKKFYWIFYFDMEMIAYHLHLIKSESVLNIKSFICKKGTRALVLKIE